MYKCCVCGKLVESKNAVCFECYANLCMDCPEGLLVNGTCNRCGTQANGELVAS